MKRIIFHIGLPKTGTTFLQQNVFPYIKNINYYDCVGQKDLKGDFAEYLNPFFLKMKEGTNLISDERITGKGFITFPYVEIIERLLRLEYIYGTDIEFILITRDKKELYRSLYKQYVKHMYGVKNYKTWLKTELDPEIKKYHWLMILMEMFFKGRYIILDYSELKKDQDGFIQKICDYLKVDFPENYNRKKLYVSPSNNQINTILKINRSRIIPRKIKTIITYAIRKGADH